ncbi:MAG: phosphatidate cytidylyltransferase [Gemmataceae bacterium]
MSISSPSPSPVKPLSEYHMRLRVGFGMAFAALGILVLDQLVGNWLGRPIYPFLFLGTAALIGLATLELHTLLDEHPRPPWLLCFASCLAVAFAGLPGLFRDGLPTWNLVTWIATASFLVLVIREMLLFRDAGGVMTRLGLFAFILLYLGLLPGYFLLLRFWPDRSPAMAGTAAMMLVIFVPKCGDIGAYFTGKALGRHRMTPLLSPKKTWEGLAGGLCSSVLVALGVHQFACPLFGSYLEASAFGLVVGVAGVLGDLAESLIKRDCRKKDASHVVPGFGGLLDVVDSVLFAAPVAYWWLLSGSTFR